MPSRPAKSGSVNRDDDSLFDFPCEFPIKVIGKADSGLDALVFTLVRPYVPDLGEGAIRGRLSRHGRYQAVTLTITARSREQLDDVYRALTGCEQVMMVF